MKKIKDSSLGYVAGLIDSEGYITVIKRSDKKMKAGHSFGYKITISNTSKKLLEHVVKILGFGKIYTNGKPRGNRVQGYYLNFQQYDTKILLSMILDYLLFKKQQAILVYKIANTDMDFDAKSSLYNQLRVLNRRGFDISKENKPFNSLVHNFNNLNEVQKGYIAGFLDGDGWIGIKKDRGNFRVCMDFTNTNLAGIQSIQKMLGAGGIQKGFRTNKKWKTSYHLTFGQTQSLLLLQAVKKYLFLKKPNAKVALKFIGLIKQKTGMSNPFCIDEKLKYYNQMRAFNVRGIQPINGESK